MGVGSAMGIPGPGHPHGIYLYRGGKWVLLRDRGEALEIGELGPGLYVVYFDNSLCPACRVQDSYWEKLVKKYGSRESIYFLVVLCDWFSDNCFSEAASETFKKFKVSASPTLVIARVKGDERQVEVLEGVRSDKIIENYLKNIGKEYVVA